MSNARPYSSDIAFTPAVKTLQSRKGSRETYARVEERGGWRTEIDENLAAFLADADSFYFATASAAGQPYIQHRGGPRASSSCWTRTRWRSQTTAATGNTLRLAICQKMPKPTSS
jgi:hypothetical protein